MDLQFEILQMHRLLIFFGQMQLLLLVEYLGLEFFYLKTTFWMNGILKFKPGLKLFFLGHQTAILLPG